MVFKGALAVEAVLVEGVALVDHAAVVPCVLASLGVTGSSVAWYSFCQTEKVGLHSLLPSYVCIWSWKGSSRLPLELQKLALPLMNCYLGVLVGENLSWMKIAQSKAVVHLKSASCPKGKYPIYERRRLQLRGS